jgi:hypothetical protein
MSDGVGGVEVEDLPSGLPGRPDRSLRPGGPSGALRALDALRALRAGRAGVADRALRPGGAGHCRVGTCRTGRAGRTLPAGGPRVALGSLCAAGPGEALGAGRTLDTGVALDPGRAGGPRHSLHALRPGRAGRAWVALELADVGPAGAAPGPQVPGVVGDIAVADGVAGGRQVGRGGDVALDRDAGTGRALRTTRALRPRHGGGRTGGPGRTLWTGTALRAGDALQALRASGPGLSRVALRALRPGRTLGARVAEHVPGVVGAVVGVADDQVAVGVHLALGDADPGDLAGRCRAGRRPVRRREGGGRGQLDGLGGGRRGLHLEPVAAVGERDRHLVEEAGPTEPEVVGGRDVGVDLAVGVDRHRERAGQQHRRVRHVDHPIGGDRREGDVADGG